ncbi:NUDIX domain-containing protein [Candidatus Parcubacteria bacterium]|nr:NUDIX domain-containing protein [Candidatus Parcubacteria bacterium]
MEKEKLNIVDENDNILGTEDRKIIHEKGLLHREVHVHFVNFENGIIFQHRAKDKDTFPDLLDATVGGHVEIGDSYEGTAIKETFEETGVKISEKDLIIIDKIHKSSKDEVTGMINHAFQKEFIYIYNGSVDDLKVEEGKALGFEIWPIKKLMNLNDDEKSKFIPCVYGFVTTVLINFIENKLKYI